MPEILYHNKNEDNYSNNVNRVKRILINTYILSNSEDDTTVTDDKAMAAEAIQGRKERPKGMNTPEQE